METIKLYTCNNNAYGYSNITCCCKRLNCVAAAAAAQQEQQRTKTSPKRSTQSCAAFIFTIKNVVQKIKYLKKQKKIINIKGLQHNTL